MGDYLEEERFAVNFLVNEYGPWLRKSFDPDIDIPENTTALFSKRYRNFLNQRCGDLLNSITTVKDEGVIDMIDNIIRLTEPNKNE